MSNFENYDVVCSNYDKGRQGVGLELYRAFLSSLDIPFNEIHVLDAGCGTGNYSADLLRHGVGKVTMMDASEGMLKYAQAKVAQFQKESIKRVDAVQSKLPELPFNDVTFDAVMINLVLHHLGDGSDPSFRQHRRFFEECFRVLKPGGILLIGTVTHFQNENCFWYCGEFLPTRVVKEYSARLAGPGQVKDQLMEIGFVNILRYTPVDEIILKPEIHFDYAGILRKEWRDMESLFSMCTPQETEEMLDKVRMRMEDGTFQERVDKYEEIRRNNGLITVLVASKPKTK